jgi:cytochrome d ubiquinol oxidase subunit I
VWLSLTGFVVFYSSLAVVDLYLLVRMIRRGPDGLGYWPEPSLQVHAPPQARTVGVVTSFPSAAE